MVVLHLLFRSLFPLLEDLKNSDSCKHAFIMMMGARSCPVSHNTNTSTTYEDSQAHDLKHAETVLCYQAIVKSLHTLTRNWWSTQTR